MNAGNQCPYYHELGGLTTDGIIGVFVRFLDLHHTLSHGSRSDSINAIFLRSIQIVQTGILHPTFRHLYGSQMRTSIITRPCLTRMMI
jgi:hypothetical protein